MDECNRFLESITNFEDPNLKRLYYNVKRIHEKRMSNKKQARKKKQKHNVMIKHETIQKFRQNELVGDKTILFMCYICKQKTQIQDAHIENKFLCLDCGKLNFEKRSAQTDLTNKIAIVTGGRVKIGFEVVLKLLRMNCFVIVSTRFPKDALERYELQSDYDQFKSRLSIKCADFRFRSSVDKFVDEIINEFTHIDILINNACQTLWKPDAWYKSLYKKEQQIQDQLHDSLQNQLQDPFQVELSNKWFPNDQKDEFGQQLDLRPTNSWVNTIQDTNVNELLENQIINCTVPFILIQKLTNLMTNSIKNKYSFIINVSALEGQFDKTNNSPRHVHTNIAKAGLNMITRTLGTSYKKQHNILINSCDTGWITNNFGKNGSHAEIIPPLDCKDGASRILDPIILALENNILFSGILLKNYQPANW